MYVCMYIYTYVLYVQVCLVLIVYVFHLLYCTFCSLPTSYSHVLASPPLFSPPHTSPFSVVPSTASLEVGAFMQVDVHFTPRTVGDHGGELVVRYESGEEVGVGLYGGAVDSNVRLDRGSVKMDSTYISMSSQR